MGHGSRLHPRRYPSCMRTSVLVLGAGFGGLELSSRLVAELGDAVDVTLIDRSDAFVFGFAKLDMTFGRRTPESIRVPYAAIANGVRFRRETITAIDPGARRVTTDQGLHEADILVVALGADYDLAATPGLAEAGNEFYSIAGAMAVREILSTFRSGRAVIGICGTPYKCPPAPSEAAFLLDDHLRALGVRDAVDIKVVSPFGIPVPPSPEMSSAILARFAERGIEFVAGRKVDALDPATHEVVLSDGSRLPYDLFLGIPVHRAPAVVLASGLAQDGWIPVEKGSAATRFPGVYAVGDVTSVPEARRVTTDAGTYGADIVVVALGADYDLAATPGLAEAGNEFYSIAGAMAVREILPTFRSGRAVIGICGTPYKCPPAPSEAAFLLDDHLRALGVRDAVDIKVVSPFGIPVPPSPEMSSAILARFAERGIEFVAGRKVDALDPATHEVVLSDGARLPYDLFLGIPVHRAPAVVLASGLAQDGWIPVEQGSAATRFPGVYAVGDVTSVGTAKAGVFAERAARVVADQLIARIRGEQEPPGYDGTGACWMEFGADEVARVDVDFFKVPGKPQGTFTPPSEQTAGEKVEFATTRRARWFGLEPEE